ncbi:alpha/beta fold hydrolase [Rubellimicrobium roseum]|uniref:Alpha/beta hydrolase n=1 Tax=Rubellimicrobium roseum TaxID=687525 RepID=A0A5C4NDT6_9RHOB|nr:alpha/beta hydrolase [Rubellimicrobium roseum]TNC71296.1 alpha/beta hydrolase [Rubellimicrobium roseum]
MTQILRAHDVDLGNGITLPVREQGDPNGPPLILLHGNTDSWRSFEPVLPFLPARLRAIAITMRGHGDATKPPTGYAPADFAADVVALLDALGLPRAVICGHSFGGLVAQMVALGHPERAEGLVLAGAFPGMEGNPAIQDFWDGTIVHLGDELDLDFAREFQAGCVAQSPAPPIVEMAARESVRTPGWVFRESVHRAMALDLRPELSRIRVPTLLIWGGQDGFVSRDDQEDLRRGIPGARLLAYEEAGHAVHWEEPERFARDLTDFVDRLRSRRAA